MRGCDGGNFGVAAGFGGVGDDDADYKESGHGGPDGPAVTRRAGHAAERVGEAAGDGKDQNHFQKICEWSGVLKRVRTVGVEEAAAVGAEHFYSFLRGDGADRDALLGHCLSGGFAVRALRLHCLWLDELGGRVWLQILDDALRDEDERDDEADREQNPQERAGQVDPEISDGFGFAAGDAANDGDGERDADGRGCEVVIRETGHLREIAHRGFGDVGLPVRVRGEGCGGVPREVGGDVGESLRIECEPMLHALDYVEKEHRDGAEEEHGGAVLGPVHFTVFVNAADFVEETLDGAESKVEESFFAIEDTRHERAERLRDGEYHCEEKGDLEPTVCGHVR